MEEPRSISTEVAVQAKARVSKSKKSTGTLVPHKDERSIVIRTVASIAPSPSAPNTSSYPVLSVRLSSADQCRLLIRLMYLLEEACHGFAKREMPGFLSEKGWSLATANGGNRAFGYPGYDAVNYVWDRISSIEGAKAWKQDLCAVFNSEIRANLTVNDENIQAYGLSQSPATPAGGITAELVAGPEGATACDAA